MDRSALGIRGLRRRAWPVVLAAIMLGTLVPSVADAATRAVTFSIELGWWCVEGRASDDVAVTVVWQNDEAVVKQRGTVRSSARGYWTLCGDSEENVEAGDIISARVGTKTRSVTVPPITLVPDRGDERHATGRGPANDLVYWSYCFRRTSEPEAVWGFRCLPANEAVTTDAEGRFDFTTPDRQVGGSFLTVTYRTFRGDTFIRAQWVPFVSVVIGKERFEGGYLPSRKLSVQLRSGGELKAEWAGRADDWSGGFGWFFGRFADDDGIAKRVRVNDRVTIPQFGANADFLVPAVEVAASKSTDVIRGTCGGDTFLVGVEAHSPDRHRSYRSGSAVGSDGAFHDDLTGDMDLRTGDIVWLHCVLGSGDEVARRTVVQ